MTTVVAEKLEAIISLGMLNSRMKDFYDIWFLARTFPFQAEALSTALLAELSGDVAKGTQWRAFLGKSRLTGPDDFAIVNDAIRDFLLPPAGAASAESQSSGSLPPSGPWQNRD